MFLLESSAEHRYNLADQDTKKKKNQKKLEDSFKIPSPEYKVTHADSILNCIEHVEVPDQEADSLYENLISDDMLQKYGPYFSKTFDRKSVEVPPDGFLKRHKFKPSMRRRFVDWMIEVFHKLDADENTFFAAVKILDLFLWKYNSQLTEKTFYEAGVTCIYIASKTYDFYPISMKDLIRKVSHNSLDEKSIKKMEGIILTAINFDIMSPGPSEFIQFLLYDLYMSNKGLISKYRLRKIIDIVENCAIWIAKMCYHFEHYSTKSPNHLAVACLFVGYEMAKDNKELNKNEKTFFLEWLKFLFNKIGDNDDGKKYIDKLYQDIYDTFTKFKKMGYNNLKKYHDLFFE